MERRESTSNATSTRSAAARSSWPLALAFFFSGAAGLVYESVWTRYLGLFVGHGAYAQVIVLVIFMGGMAAGALGVAQRSERLADPLRLYALVETAAGVLGLLFHPAFVALTELAYRAWFPAIGESNALQLVKWGLAGAMILPQSVLLGATFPLMSAGAVRRWPQSPGRVVSLLYFANSLGAAIGVLVAGFTLLSVGGLHGTLMTAAALNLVVAAWVGWIARGRAVASAAVTPVRVPAAIERPSLAPWLPRLLIGVSFGTAVASFVYEIAWTRMLALVLGSATHSFELMLSAFILGMALGAGWLQGRADRLERPIVTLACAQCAMGALALATLPLYAASFRWIAPLVRTLPSTPHGYETFSVLRYGICVAVMVPATFCAGITLPLLTRILMRTGGERAIGSIYGANTLGSILGASLAALVLLPWLGLERLLAAGAALDVALGVALLMAPTPERAARRAAVLAAATAALVIIAVLSAVRLNPLALVSGVYRTGRLLEPGETQVIFYHDGRTATVSVRLQPDGSETLSTNGKPDASLGATWLFPDSTRPQLPYSDDESTQILLAVVSLAYTPKAERAAVIGVGSGMTSHLLLGSSHLSRVATIEIEPDMIAAARLFRSANRRIFDDSRSRFVIDDARSYFAASRDRFDVIVSEPSNPWVSGVSGLFTDEFYRRVKGSLAPGGVFAQWIHLYSLYDDLVLSVLAALGRNFRGFTIHMVSSTDALIVATDREAPMLPDWSVIREPGIAADLARALPITAEQLDATWVADRFILAPLLEQVPPNSDFRPILDLGAERARFRDALAIGLLRLHADRFSLAAARAPRVAPPTKGDLALDRIPRIHELLENQHFRATLARHPAVVDTAEGRRLFAAVERIDRVRRPGAHTDPHAWLADLVRVEEDLHRGTTGAPDVAFFQSVRHTAEIGHAPSAVVQAIDLLWALEHRDPAAAAGHLDSVIAASGKTPWLDPALLFDVGVTAKLEAGDTTGARRLYQAFGLGNDPGSDLRTRLLYAWITNPRFGPR